MRRITTVALAAASFMLMSAQVADAASCTSLRADRWLAPIKALDPHAPTGTLRVFAMQFKQEPRHVITYATFLNKLECSIKDTVVPNRVKGRTSLVLFTEDLGLMAYGIGSRGKAARIAISNEGALAVIGRLRGAYRQQADWYTAKLGSIGAIGGAFTAATDTVVRGFVQSLSTLAKKYGVYIGASSLLAPFTESTRSSDIEALADPDLSPRPKSVFVATSPKVYNRAILWGPRDVRATGPAPLRNSVLMNDKVPLTDLEVGIEVSPGASTGAAGVSNLKPYSVPGTKAKVQFATSLPAFMFGAPAKGAECADTALSYMRCLESLGTNVVLQDEANPGPWVNAGSLWQPLDWMGSTWRSVADQATPGLLYNVTPMMTGNLADLAFDGQSAITQRGLKGIGCAYVGNINGDGNSASGVAQYMGRKSEFLAIAPWVAADGPAAELRSVSAGLAPGSGSGHENSYLETSLVADLTFPPKPLRAGCITSQPPR